MLDTVDDKLESLAYCFDHGYQEDAAGHLCDLLEYCRQRIRNRDGIVCFGTLTAMVEKYGMYPASLMPPKAKEKT